MAPSVTARENVSILDIRHSEIQFSIHDDLHSQLRPKNGGEKKMPTMLLYDEQGLKLFEDITYLEEYYLTNAEIDVLTHYADHIAERIQNGSQVIELGSGNLRKVQLLLDALERAEKYVDYFALDLSLAELQRTLSAVPTGTYEYVRCHGLLGTYDDGLDWLKMPENANIPKCILWLGSSIGNFDRKSAADFLGKFTKVLGPRDCMLIGIDGCQDKDVVYHAYNDREGKTHEFVRNGLTHANKILGREVFKQEDWEVIGEYDVAAGRHHAFYSPLKDIQFDDIKFKAGERVRIEESYKYSAAQTERLWEESGLVPRAMFGNQTGIYHVYMASIPTFSYSLRPEEYAAKPVPSLEDWEQLWKAWDTVTKWMIPKEALLSKPIELRNVCLFYLGHIPTFADIHVARATDGHATEPADYRRIFERGIDPDVDNPDQCHAHSEIPDTWPLAEEIIEFQEHVRQRIRSFYYKKTTETDRKLGRALWLAFEHEVMHLETLLYMLLQSDKTLPPPGTKPDFEALAHEAHVHAVQNEWVKVPARKITIGTDDPDNDLGPDRYFVWDNERPSYEVSVPAFEAKARPITNEDYALYLSSAGQEAVPASWTVNKSPKSANQNGVSLSERNGNSTYINGHGPPLTDAFLNAKDVKTVYGLVPLAYALDWPAMASYDELAGCAQWMGGRIPTMEETRSIYNYVDEIKVKIVGKVRNGTIPAVNGHLSNEGVEETPPSPPLSKTLSQTEQISFLDPHTLFANIEGCNVGFKHFHPMPVTANGNQLAGRCEMGGVWEWTSSVLERHEGFEPMAMYPAYTADFFDGKHNIVLGGSWATHPRVAGRKTFVNWYQRNYPFAWCGARLVRDLKE